MKIVLEGFSGTISVADLCRKYDIKPARFYSWKEKLMNSSAKIFDDRGRKSKSEQLIIEEQRIEIERLKGTIADVVSENLEIKKKIGERLQRREWI
jgi:transposase-like protein